MTVMRTAASLLALGLLSACISIGPSLERKDAPVATAVLLDASGDTLGTAALMEIEYRGEETEGKREKDEDGYAVRITFRMQHLQPGEHGLHVHAVGRCDPPDFASAGGHLNPTNREHGLDNEAGPHLGDLPNLVANAEGVAVQEVLNTRARLLEGGNALLDEDGAALVVHAGPDDGTSNPSGNSGDRVACGVIRARK